MEKTKLTLWYPVFYLIPSGIMLAVAPNLALKLLFSNGSYGEVMPRLLGVILIGLGSLVVQVIRLRLTAMYRTIIGVRAFFLPCWLLLYFYSKDPMFLSLFGVVGFGFLLSLGTALRDR